MLAVYYVVGPCWQVDLLHALLYQVGGCIHSCDELIDELLQSNAGMKACSIEPALNE